MPLQPVVDGHFTPDPFLPDDPVRLIKAGAYHQDIEILLGFNEEEGHMVTSIFEAFPLLYSAMAAGWPVLGPFREGKICVSMETGVTCGNLG